MLFSFGKTEMSNYPKKSASYISPTFYKIIVWQSVIFNIAAGGFRASRDARQSERDVRHSAHNASTSRKEGEYTGKTAGGRHKAFTAPRSRSMYSIGFTLLCLALVAALLFLICFPIFPQSLPPYMSRERWREMIKVSELSSQLIGILIIDCEVWGS